MAEPLPRVAALRYRKIGPLTEEDWLTTTAVPTETFERQMARVHRSDWKPVDAKTFAMGLREPEDLPDRTLLITFDGAYAHLVERAVPVLRRYRFPAVAFVATDRVGERFTYDPDADTPEPLCGWEDLRALESADVSVQSFGCTHQPLTGLSPSELEAEVAESKATIERRLGSRVWLFAYPQGDPGADPDATAKVLRLAGYRAALGTSGGVLEAPLEDPFRIGRITIGQSTDVLAELDG
ncbi:MAG: polysaccharide deacetylase family protein [Gemmatimonadota bacterium]|nr:polysaccharide deacetylase family protein [Gemmatimonadota bacterium]